MPEQKADEALIPCAKCLKKYRFVDAKITSDSYRVCSDECVAMCESNMICGMRGCTKPWDQTKTSSRDCIDCLAKDELRGQKRKFHLRSKDDPSLLWDEEKEKALAVGNANRMLDRMKDKVS